MKLIVGLGNPGKEYEKTRHNIGFMVIDEYLGSVKYQEKFSGQYCEKMINGEKIIFLKPQTYMNNSGNSVIKFVNYYDLKPEEILVIQDDLDHEIGKFKIKVNSSSGGHNGIKSIISALGTESFPRLKIGIASEKKNDVVDFVLGKFSKNEEQEIAKNIEIYKEIIDSFIEKGIDKTMNVYNTR